MTIIICSNSNDNVISQVQTEINWRDEMNPSENGNGNEWTCDKEMTRSLGPTVGLVCASVCLCMLIT